MDPRIQDARIRQICGEMLHYHCPRYAELPDIPLYRDQVIDSLNRYLAPIFAPAHEPVTAAMINNYVKLKVIAPPVKKRYDREQLARLYFVCLFKQVMSISDIRALMAIQTRTYPFPEAYDYFCVELEKALQATFGSRDFSAPSSAHRITPESELVRSTAICLANRVFAAKFLALDACLQLDPGGQLAE